MRELTIAASAVRALLNLAVAKGANRQDLFAAASLDSAALADPDNRIAFGTYVALMKAAQRLCNDPAFALHYGEEVDVSEVSIACTIGGFTTIDEAFAQVNHYSRLGVEVEGVGSGDRFVLSREQGQLWIVDTRQNPNDFPEMTESSFARMICSTRRTFGDVQFLKQLHVTHAEPAYSAEYQRIFRVPVVFRSDRNAMGIDETIVSRTRLPPASQYVTQVLRDHADTLLKRLDDSVTTRGRVEGALAPLLQRGDVRIETVSRELGLSRQTLFRRLKSEGVTFEIVLDELRHRLALHHLGAPNPSVDQVARLVGYSDSTAFSRAFKRWTGQTPRRHSAQRTR